MIKKHSMKMNRTYLLDDDINYKILILHILKTLDNDIKQKIFDILIKEEIEEFLNQEFTELSIETLRDLVELDYYLDLELYSDQ